MTATIDDAAADEPNQQAGVEAGVPGFELADDDGGATLDLDALLMGLQSMRNGDFSVRLPGNRIGIAGNLALTSFHVLARLGLPNGVLARAT